MKRRSFLQMLTAATVAPSATLKAATHDNSEWHPEWYEYGNYGIQKIRVLGHSFKVLAYYPENDWLNKKEGLNEFYWNDPFLTDTNAVRDPWFVLPVNELSTVEVHIDNGEVYKFTPEWDGEKFRPVELHSAYVGPYCNIRDNDNE